MRTYGGLRWPCMLGEILLGLVYDFTGEAFACHASFGVGATEYQTSKGRPASRTYNESLKAE